jgi:hypothetical protein
MEIGGFMKRNVMLVIVAVLGLIAIAHADVTVQMKTTLSGFMGMSTEGQDIQYIKGDKSFHDISSKFTGGLMKTMTGGKANSTQQIIRIDKQLIWSVKPEDKAYTEMTFDMFKQSMEQAASAFKEMDTKPKEPGDLVWTVTVKTSDKCEKIAGYDCKLVTGKAVGINKKDSKDTTTIIMNYWLGSGVVGEQELKAFQESFARALALDEMELRQGMASMMKNYGDQFRQLGEEMAKTKGYPLKTAIEVLSSATKTGSSENMDEGNQGQPQSVSDIMGKLGGKFGKKAVGKDDKNEKDINPNRIFSMTSEVVNIATGAIDDAKFEVPTGFKKQEIK